MAFIFNSFQKEIENKQDIDLKLEWKSKMSKKHSQSKLSSVTKSYPSQFCPLANGFGMMDDPSQSFIFSF